MWVKLGLKNHFQTMSLSSKKLVLLYIFIHDYLKACKFSEKCFGLDPEDHVIPYANFSKKRAKTIRCIHHSIISDLKISETFLQHFARNKNVKTGTQIWVKIPYLCFISFSNFHKIDFSSIQPYGAFVNWKICKMSL